eukprot:GFUD01026828.1.p1 GENE.GFUD01026828.1~~GFUD01026828.1.p1  ORF type:complete len:612 (+),score=176.20 GFUD01026828.1:251-2086(+)
MEVTGTKVVVLLLLGIIKLFFGLAPLALAKAIKKQKNDWWIRKFIGTVLCVGGGVLLSTVFIHMMKEVRMSMDRATDMGMLPKEAEYPFAELIICMGFLLILLVESIAHKFFGGHGHGHGHSPAMSDTKEDSYLDSPQEITVKIPRVTGSQVVYDNQAYQEESHGEQGGESVKPSSGSSPYFANRKMEATGSVYNMPHSSLAPINTYSSATDSLAIKHSNTPSKARQARDTRRLLSSLRGLLVVMALSVHSLFEGMAVGLEETSGGVWQLFMAIAIHSTAIVFCVGTEMVSNGTRKAKVVVYMVVLSVVTPLGVIIGLVLTLHAQTETGAHVLLVGILQGVAGGTLLYITFFEVLSRDKLAKYGMSGLMGALTIMVGFIVMAALNGMGGHSHGGGGQHVQEGHGHAGHHGQDGQGHAHTDRIQTNHSGNTEHEHSEEHLKLKHLEHVHDKGNGSHNPYDHFHEEYDLDHGDHVHHIEPHDKNNHHSEKLEYEDFLFDSEDYLDINKRKPSEFHHENQDNEHHDPNHSHAESTPHSHDLNILEELVDKLEEEDGKSLSGVKDANLHASEHPDPVPGHGHQHHEVQHMQGHGEGDHEHESDYSHDDTIFDYYS